MILVISTLDSIEIDVHIFIFNIMKFQTLRAFYSSPVQILLTIPSATQYPLCATQSYPIAFKSINVENHKNMVTTPSLFNKKWSWLKLNSQVFGVKMPLVSQNTG